MVGDYSVAEQFLRSVGINADATDSGTKKAVSTFALTAFFISFRKQPIKPLFYHVMHEVLQLLLLVFLEEP
jgi:protein tyrosine/serine phosphatase